MGGHFRTTRNRVQKDKLKFEEVLAENSVSNPIISLEIIDFMPEYTENRDKKLFCNKLTLDNTRECNVFVLIEMEFKTLVLKRKIGRETLRQVATSEKLEFLNIAYIDKETRTYIVEILQPLLLRNSFWRFRFAASNFLHTDNNELLSELLGKPKQWFTVVSDKDENELYFYFALETSPKEDYYPHIEIWYKSVVYLSNFIKLVLQKGEIQRIRITNIANQTDENTNFVVEHLRNELPTLTFEPRDGGIIDIRRSGVQQIVNERQSTFSMSSFVDQES